MNRRDIILAAAAAIALPAAAEASVPQIVGQASPEELNYRYLNFLQNEAYRLANGLGLWSPDTGILVPQDRHFNLWLNADTKPWSPSIAFTKPATRAVSVLSAVGIDRAHDPLGLYFGDKA